MKKLIILLLSLVVFNTVNAQNSVTAKRFPVQLSLVYPIGTQGKASKNYCYNLSVNIAYGRTGGVNGIELSGLAGVNQGNVNGVQLSGLASLTDQVNGVQINGLAGAGYTINGVQINGLLGVIDNVKGVQINGLLGLANKFKGLQISTVNVTNKVSGVQIGIVNHTREMKGLQLGLVNINRSNVAGLPIGIVNIVKYNRYSQWELFSSDIINIGASYKLGMRKFYNIYSVGYNFFEDQLFSAGFGFGSNISISKDNKYQFQPELVNYTYFPTDFENIRYTGATQLKLGFVRTFGKVGIFLAPSVYLSVMDKKDNVYGYKISPIKAVYNKQNSGNKISIGVGYTLGISLM